MCMCLCRMSQPLLIGGLLSYFTPLDSEKSQSMDIKYAYMYASGLVINMLVSLILYHATQMQILHSGMKMRVACCSTIFYKVYKIYACKKNDIYIIKDHVYKFVIN